MKTDSQIQLDVLAELAWEPSVNAADIGVEVDDGIVTLAGHVDSYAAKWDAERATQRVAGVRAVAVEMDVKLVVSAERTDTDIARSATNVLLWTIHVPKDAVSVMVEQGWVTLSGNVEWEYQRSAASAAVRYLMGVTGVSNQISVKPKVSAGSMKADIEAALKRRAHKEANHITVSVRDHDVTLSGTAKSWAERDSIRNTAWGTSGVWKVTDNVTLS